MSMRTHDVASWKNVRFFSRSLLDFSFNCTVPQDTTVVGNYEQLDYQHSSVSGDGITITVVDPVRQTLITQIASQSGRFAFTTSAGGEHSICLSAASTTSSVKTFRFSLRLDSGESATDYAEIARVEHLSAIEVEIRKLNDKLDTVRNELDYLKRREESFRDFSEIACERVLWMSVGVASLLGIAGLFQILNLRSFFRLQKLI